MATVEHAQLGVFIRLGMRHQGCASILPPRAGASEAVFDDPMAERLCHHWPGVIHAQLMGNSEAVLVRRFGHDAVDHRIGKRAELRDPCGQLAINSGSKRKD